MSVRPSTLLRVDVLAIDRDGAGDAHLVQIARASVSFVEAMSAFLDEHSVAAPDKEHPGRFVLIGMSRELRVLFVVSAEVGERVPLISARKASPTQRRMYEHGPQRRD